MLSCVQSVEQIIRYHPSIQTNNLYVIMRAISWIVYMLSSVQSVEQIIWYHPSIQTNNLYVNMRTISWTVYVLQCPNSVGIRFLELSNFCSSLDGFWTHTIDTVQHHSLSLTASALDHSTTSTHLYVGHLINDMKLGCIRISFDFLIYIFMNTTRGV
jgi:hypothetical protein